MNFGEKNKYGLPETFRDVLWSYKFDEIDPDKFKKTIVTNSINFGNLSHWRWIASCYGEGTVKNLLGQLKNTEIRPQSRELARLLFDM